MLIAVQFPFTDARLFLPEVANRLGRPRWLIPKTGKDFIRRFGPVLPRPGGGVDDWPSEDVWCGADRAVRFDDSFETFRGNYRSLGAGFACAFRRFLSDGRAVARLEIGFGHDKTSRGANRFQGDKWLDLLTDLTQINVGVPLPDSTLPAVPGRSKPPRRLRGYQRSALIDAPPLIAATYLKATTRITKGVPEPTKNWWFAPGMPLIVISYRGIEAGGSPTIEEHWSLGQVQNVHLDYFKVRFGATDTGVWFLEAGDAVDADLVRRIRLHLFRLHAEHESLGRILNLMADQILSVQPKSEGTERLSDYLLRALRILNKKTPFGLPQSDLLKSVQEFEEIISPGARASLLAAVEEMRGNVKRAVAAYTAQAGKRPLVVIKTYNKYVGDFMPNRSITITNSTVGGSVANNIKDSFNNAAAAANPEMAAALKQLTEQVMELMKQLPPEQADEVSSDLASLSKEAVSKQPRQEWWQLSAKGLKDAAQAVVGIGPLVIEAVGKVVALLA